MKRVVMLCMMLVTSFLIVSCTANNQQDTVVDSTDTQDHRTNTTSLTENVSSTAQEGCTQAGEYSFRPIPDFKERPCCAGLNKIDECSQYRPDLEAPYVDDKGCTVDMVGCGTACSACGNSVCESWENRCNCQADCR